MHTGAHSYQEKELKALRSRQVTAQLAATLSLPDPLKFESSPGLLERVVAKSEKYSRLLQVAKKQAIEKKPKQAPSFLTFAIADYGELAPQAVELQEWLVSISCQTRARREAPGWMQAGRFGSELSAAVTPPSAIGQSRWLRRNASKSWATMVLTAFVVFVVRTYVLYTRNMEDSNVATSIMCQSSLNN